MAEEKMDLYDIDRTFQNKTILRKDTIVGDLCRVTIHICLFNKNGEMLIQQRSSTKKNLPNVWDITLGGGVLAGENSREAAHRELFEELGIDFDFSNTRPHFTFNFKNGFDDYYVIVKDIDLADVKFSDGEVQAVKWAKEKDILKMIKRGQFIGYYPSAIKFLFETYDDHNMFNVKNIKNKKVAKQRKKTYKGQI